VLIVEDQPMTAVALTMIVSDAGCEVVGTAIDATGALNKARGTHVDLAFVDVNLTDGISGPDVARDLIQEHGASVIFITANPEQVPANMNGALGCISKPFDEDTVFEVIGFVRRYLHEGVIGAIPRRMRPAPWIPLPPRR
jgi:two-component system, response regulator PdtaR